MATISHKRGDTFELTCSLENQGNDVDMTGWSIAAQLRKTDDTLVQDMTVTVTDAAAGEFKITAADTETDDWPIENLEIDVQFTEFSGNISSSETFTIAVIKDITRVA
jgi:hypothetical protein